MSSTRSDRDTDAADALDLRRLSQLTAATAGSSALSLHEWNPSASPGDDEPASPALSLVPVDAPVNREPRYLEPLCRPKSQQGAPCARPPVVDDGALQAQAHGLAQALVEILAGDRTLTQLVRWTSAEVYEQLHHRVQTLATCPRPAATVRTQAVGQPVRRRRRRPRVASLHVSTPTEGIAEVSARIDHGVRSTAIALRLELRSARPMGADAMVRRVPAERWLCTAVSWA